MGKYSALKRSASSQTSSTKYGELETGAMHFAAETPVMAGAAVGAEYGAGLGTAVAPGVGTVVGGVVGGLVGAGVGMLGKYAALSKMPETKAALEEAERQNPTSAFTGQIVSQGVGFGVGAVGRTGAEKLASMTLGGAIGGGVEAGSEIIEGKDLDPTRIAIATAGGTVFSGAARDIWKKTAEGVTHPKQVARNIRQGFTPVTSKETKPVDPEFEKSRIREDESISQVVQRKYDAERQLKKDVASDVDQSVTAETKVEEPIKPLAKGQLAGTDKNNNIRLNDDAIEKDFSEDFKYIFDASTPAGIQKAAVFKALNINKETFKSLVRDTDDYKSLLHLHEQSHVRNGDHANYPRDANGELDLMSPEAIAIETRATKEAFDELYKLKVATGKLRTETAEEEALDILQGVNNNLKADARQTRIWVDFINSNIPNEKLRTLVTRAIEGEKDYDRLLTVAERNKLLYGDGKTSRGLNGALEGMRKNLDKPGFVPPRGESVEAYKAKADRLEMVIKQRETIPAEEEAHALSFLKEIQKRFADIGKNAQSAGVIDGLRDNYVAHVLDFSKSTLDKKGQQALMDKIFNTPKESKLVRDFAQHRTYEFLRDLEELVQGTGVVVHTDIAKIAEAYEKSMQAAIIHKNMISKLSHMKGPDGKAWLVPYSREAIRDGYREFVGKGSRPIEGLVVHPDLVDAMGFLFRQNDPSMIVRGLSGVTHLTKVINTVASLFHAKSLIEAGGLTSPKLLLKEIMAEGKYAVTGGKSVGSGARQAMNALRYGTGDDQMADQWMREGLQIEVEDVQRSIVADTGKFIDDQVSRLGKDLKLVQHITDPLDEKVLQKLNAFTWDYMHAGQKLNIANHLYANIKAKNPQFNEEELAQARKEVINYVNQTLGGLDWLGVARQVQNKYAKAFAMKAAGINGREWAQIILFAPDWTVSTLRAFTTALPKEIRKPQNWELRKGVKGLANPTTTGDFARRYVISTAIAWMTILNGFNYAFANKPIWENNDPTRIDMGDGTTVQGAKHSMEAVHWLSNPDKTLGNKLGFFPKALFVSTTGVAYPSPTAPKLEDTSVVGRAKAVAMLAAPFQVSSAMQAPEGEKLKRATMSTLGVPIYGKRKDQYLNLEELRQRKLERRLKRQEKIKEKIEQLRK